MGIRVYLQPNDYILVTEAESWDVKFNAPTQQDVLHLYKSDGKETARFTQWVGVQKHV